MAAKSGENWNFSLLTGYSCTTLWVKTLLKITLSLMVFMIFTLFHFPLKSKMAAKSGENWNFSLRRRILLNYPVGQKFAQNRSISYRLRDIFNVLFSAEIQDGRQKWRKLKFSPLHRILLYYPVGQKFAWNHSISYGFQIFTLFHFSAKIQDGRQKWRKLKFFPYSQDTLVLPCG